MAVLQSDTVFADATESSTPQWLTATGILILIGTIIHELAVISSDTSIEIISEAADALSIFI